ncbi:hypothetical protein [Chitinophaga varians]|uniref:hypothetical protein n=1 Tax=Chitinophaga varians TaxID=2202339 RepID=UPI00165FB023|nr:hypothetical protein [Chitinophaga varians]MBC9909443.1 hypothetical protein [Chitinophaga varians]
MKGTFSLLLWMNAILMPGHLFGQWPPKSTKNTSQLITIEINDKGAFSGTLPPTLHPSDRLVFLIRIADAADTGHIDVYRQALVTYDELWKNGSYKDGYESMFGEDATARAAERAEIANTIKFLDTRDTSLLTGLKSNKWVPVPRSDFALPSSRVTLSFPGIKPRQLALTVTDQGVVSDTFKLAEFGNYRTEQTFTYQVELVDKYRELVIDHFRKTHSYFQRDGEKKWHQLLKEILSHAPLMDSVGTLMKAHAAGKIDDTTFNAALQTKCSRINVVTALLNQLSESGNNRWLAPWLWYTKGSLRFNPFDFSNGQPLKDYATARFKPDTSQYYRSFIATVDAAVDQLRTHPKPNSPDSILLLAEKKKQGVTKLLDNSTALAFIDKNNKAADAFQQSEMVVYKGNLLVSTADQLRFVRYHNGLKGYTLSSRLPKDYPEDYAMYVGLVNVPGNKIVTLDQRLSDFTDKAEFTTQVQESLGAITKGKSTVTDAAKTFASLFSTVKKSGEDVNPLCTDNAETTYLHYLFVTAGYKGDLPVPEKLANQTDSSDYKYSTILAGQDDKAAPFTNEYSIEERLASDTSKKQVAKGFRYNVGKLRSFAIGAGLAFGFSQVSQVNVDSAGAISSSTDAARAKFIVGLKYYPFKTFLRDNGICPRWPERRFSLFGGFEVLDPLNNLYLGVGYDIVPGLNINVGANFYRQHYYRLQNDRILDKATRMPAVGYLAITLDPEVVVDLIKLMAK